MTLTDLFASLGAPLRNQRWSWGAVRESDGAVFLRIWQDEIKKVDGVMHAPVTAIEAFAGRESNFGFAERMRHVDLIRDGAPSFLIMCVAVDTTADPRSIQRFMADELFVGGKVREHDGDWWVALVERRPVEEVRNQIVAKSD